jgi:hypothetical protein
MGKGQDFFAKFVIYARSPDDAGADGPVQEVEETRVWAFIERVVFLDEIHGS